MYWKIHSKGFVCLQADVIVNSVDGQLRLQYGAVSKAISNAAGKEMQMEINRRYPGGKQEWEIAETPAYYIKDCKKVFHVVLQENKSEQCRQVNSYG